MVLVLTERPLQSLQSDLLPHQGYSHGRQPSPLAAGDVLSADSQQSRQAGTADVCVQGGYGGAPTG